MIAATGTRQHSFADGVQRSQEAGEEPNRHDQNTARPEATDAAARQAETSEAAARMRMMLMVPTSVDTKLTSNPETFSGTHSESPRWSLRSYWRAVSGWMLELLKVAEGANQSLDRVEFEPGDDVHDAQLHLIVTMLLKGTFMDKVKWSWGVAIVEITDCGYGSSLNLRHKFDNRKMVLQQRFINFSFGASEDPRKGIDRLEIQIRQYKVTTKKEIEDDTRT